MRAWPLLDLTLRTPRLVLRPLGDADLDGFVEAACSGIHDADVQPFADRWTEGTPDDIRRTVLQRHWRTRAELSHDSWTLQLGVHQDGRLVGMQSLKASDFRAARVVRTSSWVRRASHGAGIGTEMRTAALLFAFDLLGAEAATSTAFARHAPASVAISRRLGYAETGRGIAVVAGERVEEIRLRVDAAGFVRPAWTLAVAGWEAARADLVGDVPIGEAGR